MYRIRLSNPAFFALVAGTLIFALGIVSYFAFEPSISRSAEEIFEVSQTITSEISFYASTTDVMYFLGFSARQYFFIFQHISIQPPEEPLEEAFVV